MPVKGFTVRDPTSLAVVSDSGTQLTYDCPPADGGYACGAQRQILYQLRDALGPIAIQGIPLSESFTAGADGCSLNSSVPSPGSPFTTSAGDFPNPDKLWLCSTTCSAGSCPPVGSCTAAFTQVWSANGIPVRTNALDYECSKVLVNGQ